MSGEDYFSALAVDRNFLLEPALLEKRFYEISRALHPDRFTTSHADARRYSLERMSFVNDAYRTLKDRANRRLYLLQLEGALPREARGETEQSASGSMPVELAESWFELQDALSEDPSQAKAKVVEFEAALKELKDLGEKELQALEQRADAERAGAEAIWRATLEKMAARIREASYFRSMERDVERLKSRLS